MKIMTYNTQHCLNYVTREIDYHLFANTIKSFGADLVGLNEMRGEGEVEGFDAQVKILSELCGIDNYYFAKAIDVHGAPSPYGNGIISKYRIKKAITIPVPDPDKNSRCGTHRYETRCLLKAELECGLTVLIIHFGLNPEEQINAVNTVLENLEEEKCILMGDFNNVPTAEVLRPIYTRMKDAAEGFCQDTKTFPSYAPERKIDYIFVTPDVEVIHAEIPDIVTSDHRPHIAEIR